MARWKDWTHRGQVSSPFALPWPSLGPLGPPMGAALPLAPESPVTTCARLPKGAGHRWQGRACRGLSQGPLPDGWGCKDNTRCRDLDNGIGPLSGAGPIVVSDAGYRLVAPGYTGCSHACIALAAMRTCAAPIRCPSCVRWQ